MTATCAESATNAESRTSPASGSLPTPARAEPTEKIGVCEPCTCEPASLNCPACTAAERPCLLCRANPAEDAEKAPSDRSPHLCPMCGLDSEEEAPRGCLAPRTNHPARCRVCGGFGWLDDFSACSEECSAVAEQRFEVDLLPPQKAEDHHLVSVPPGPLSYDHREELKVLPLLQEVAKRATAASSAGVAATRAVPRCRDASRTRSEARLVFRTPLVGGEDGLDDRRFSALDVTAGLPDDDRAEDQRARSRAEAERRGRVAAAKAALAEAAPEVATQVFRDQVKLARFCARFSIAPSDICPHGGDTSPLGTRCGWCRGTHNGFHPVHVEDLSEVLRSPCDYLAEVRAREAAVLPDSGEGWA